MTRVICLFLYSYTSPVHTPVPLLHCSYYSQLRLLRNHSHNLRLKVVTSPYQGSEQHKGVGARLPQTNTKQRIRDGKTWEYIRSLGTGNP